MRKELFYYLVFGGWMMIILGIIADDIVLATILWMTGLFVLIIRSLKESIADDEQDLEYMKEIKAATYETRRLLREF